MRFSSPSFFHPPMASSEISRTKRCASARACVDRVCGGQGTGRGRDHCNMDMAGNAMAPGDISEKVSTRSQELSDPRNRNHKSLAIGNHNFDIASFSSGCRKRSGHFLVTFSDASVTFFITFLPNSFCRTPFAAG